MDILGVRDAQVTKGVVVDEVRWMGSDRNGMDSCTPIETDKKSLSRMVRTALSRVEMQCLEILTCWNYSEFRIALEESLVDKPRRHGLQPLTQRLPEKSISSTTFWWLVETKIVSEYPDGGKRGRTRIW